MNNLRNFLAKLHVRVGKAHVFPVLLSSLIIVGCNNDQTGTQPPSGQPPANQQPAQRLLPQNQGGILYDFVANFDRGSVTPETKTATPTGKGAALLPLTLEQKAEQTLTILTGFQYKSAPIIVPSKSQLVLSYAMRFKESDGMSFRVFLYESAKKDFLLDIPVKVPPKWETSRVSLSKYAGKTMSVAVEGYSPSGNLNYDWLAFRQLQIVPE